MRTRTYRLLGSLAMTAMSVTQCGQQDTSEWLIVDNRTDSLIVITQEGDDGRFQVSEIGPDTEGFTGGKKYCAAQAFEARLESIEGPVIDRRPASAGERCIEVWVIEDR